MMIKPKPSDDLEDSYPHSDAILFVFVLKLHCFAPTAITASDVKPDVS